MCSEHSSEDNLESVASKLPTKEFIIPQGTQYCCLFLILSTTHFLSPLDADVISHLQGHCHWLVEMAVKMVSAITKATTDVVSYLFDHMTRQLYVCYNTVACMHCTCVGS